LFAESLLNLRPCDQWLRDGTPLPGTLEAVKTLEAAIKLNPKNPLALHLYIHTVEASPTPERAVWAADALRDLQPGLGHNVHMPTHIDVRVGAWQKAIDSNYKAIVADRNYRAKRPDQFIYRIYMAHNNHMLAFAAMMNGQSALAIEMLDDMVAVMPDEFRVAAAPFIDGFIAMPMEVRKRFGKWDEVLAMPQVPEHFPLSRAMRHAARGVSWAAKGESSKARQEQFLFYRAVTKIPESQTFGQNSARKIAQVAMHVLNGEILVCEGKADRAVAELRRGVAVEDTLRFSEPPDWIQPTRHTLGALLVRVGRHREAEEVYVADLKKLPNNGWALYGLAECYDARGKSADAQRTRARFQEIWAKADITITSSCLCIPNK
jgi:tetratricopeptide (TPR) repeat protein